MKNGWEIRKLGEVFEIKPQKSEARSKLKGTDMVSFIPMEDLGIMSKNVFPNQERQLQEVLSSYTYFAENDLLLAKITPCFENGKIGIATNLKNGIGFGSSEYLVFRSNGKIIQDYLYYYLSRDIFREEGKKLMTDAVGHKRITNDFIGNYLIPFPNSIAEQQCIVSILDEAFTSIDQAKENLQRNLLNAKELFQSKKNNIFQKLIEEEKIVPLPFTCKEIFAGGDAPTDNFSSEKNEIFNIPIIANAVKDKGLYGYTNLGRVTEPSISIAARGSGTGYTEIRYEPFFPIVRLIVLTPKIEVISLEFLKYSIQNLDILRSGTAIPQLTVPMIKDYSIPLPSLLVQQGIVKQLDALSAETKRLEELYQQKLNNLEDLKKSILQKAFNGDLTSLNKAMI